MLQARACMRDLRRRSRYDDSDDEMCHFISSLDDRLITSPANYLHVCTSRTCDLLSYRRFVQQKNGIHVSELTLRQSGVLSEIYSNTPVKTTTQTATHKHSDSFSDNRCRHSHSVLQARH